jgi:lipoprotein NlpI
MKLRTLPAFLLLLGAGATPAQESSVTPVAVDLAPEAAREEESLNHMIREAGDTVPQGYYLARGIARFFQANIKGSLEDFDLVAKVDDARPGLWQRGLALYYAGRFEDGVKQFEEHQTVNGRDVENAAWHFLCVAKLRGLDAARKELIPIEGDSRAGLQEIHRFYAGKGDEADILAAAERVKGEERKNALCYAHLYLGLYHEVAGNGEKAREHMKLSAIDFAMPHYMGQVSRVHRKVRGWE